MPKRAPTDAAVDPVRSRLAASVASAPPLQAASNGEAVGGQTTPLTKRPVAPKTPPPKAARPDAGAFRVGKKFLVTDDESDRMEATLDSISQAFGSRVTYAQASRAMWAVLAIAEEALASNPRRGEPLRRPSKGDALGMAEYEAELCDYLRLALKRT